MKVQARPSICTASPDALGSALTLGSTGNAAWPAANDALFVPVTLSRPILVKRMFVVNNNSVSGNIDVGIYSVDGARIVSIGTTAQAGASALQFFNITDTYLSPGEYYMAVAMNNGTGGVKRWNITVIRQQQLGLLKMATAFPLPAAATFATVTATYIPSMGMELVGIV